MGNYGTYAGEYLTSNKIFTVDWYEGTHASVATIHLPGSGVRQDGYTITVPIKDGNFVKVYTSADNAFQKVAADDDGAKVVGIAIDYPQGDTSGVTRRTGNCYFFTPGDIILCTVDPANSAIVIGDPVSIGATAVVDTACHGAYVDKAPAGDLGFGYALDSASAAAGAGNYIRVMIKAEMTRDQTITANLGATALEQVIYPLFLAPYAGELMYVRYKATSASGDASANIAVAGADIWSSDKTDFGATAKGVVPDAATTFAAGELIALDVSANGTNVDGLMVQLEVRYKVR